MLMEPSNNIHSFISVDNTQDTSFVHKIQTLLMKILKQRFLNLTKIYYISEMVVVDNIKFSRTSLIYVLLKTTFTSKQRRFSLQQATGNHRVMELVVQWNAMLQNEFCRDSSTTKYWTIARCRKYAQKKLKESLALTKKTWSRWERRWRRGSKVVRQYLVQEAVIILFPSEHHKLNTNCAVRMIRLCTSMTSKFQPKLILATLHHRLTSLACTFRCSESVWWTKLMRSKVMYMSNSCTPMDHGKHSTGHKVVIAAMSL